MSIYKTVLEECSQDGACSLGNRSISTYYRVARIVNEMLEYAGADWRVKAIAQDHTIYAEPLESNKR